MFRRIDKTGSVYKRVGAARTDVEDRDSVLVGEPGSLLRVHARAAALMRDRVVQLEQLGVRIEDPAHGIRGQVGPAAAEVREDSAALGGAPGAAAHPGAEAAVAASARVIICNGDTLQVKLTRWKARRMEKTS